MPDNSQTFKIEVDFVTKNQELFDKANKKAKETVTAAKSIKNAYAEYGDELKKLNPELHKQIELEKAQAQVLQKNKEAAKNLSLQIREIRAQAKEIRASVALLKDSADDIDRIAKPLFAGGAFIVGGIFAAANKYVANAKEATETTIAWKKAQDSLNQSGLKIGEVLAKTALPLLIKAAEFTAKVATFIEAHPEVVKAGLNAGLIALTLGAIGKAVSGGIRLYADFKMDAALTLQYTAAQLQLKAAQTQLAASGGKGAIGGATTAATTAGSAGGGFLATTAGATIATAVAVLGGLVAGVKIYDALIGGKNGFAKAADFAPATAFQGGTKFGNALQGLTGMSDKEIERKAIVFSALIGRVTGSIDENSELWLGASKLAKQGAENLSQANTQSQMAMQQEKESQLAIRELRKQERIDRLKEYAENIKAEINLLRLSQADKLKTIQSAFMQESSIRRQAFVAGLTDLGKNLTAELMMKRQAFQTLLNQAADMLRNAWNQVRSFLGLNNTVHATSSGGTAGTASASASAGTASSTWSFANLFGTRDEGGYTNKGIYRMAWNGQPEFVLSGASTRLAEKMVGGKLTQQTATAAMQGGARGQVTYNDNRRFDGQYTSAMKREVQRDTQAVLTKVFST